MIFKIILTCFAPNISNLYTEETSSLRGFEEVEVSCVSLFTWIASAQERAARSCSARTLCLFYVLRVRLHVRLWQGPVRTEFVNIL